MGPTPTKAKCTWTENTGCVYVLIQLTNSMVASGINNYIQIWDFQKEMYGCVSILIGHNDSVSSLLELKFRNQLISGSCDSTMRIWNLCNYQCETIINAHIWNISCIIELPFQRLVTSSWDHTLRLWNSITLKNLSYEEHSEAVTALLSLDDGRIVSGGDDNILIIWNVNSKTIYVDDKETDNNLPMQSFHKLIGHSKHISCLILLKNNNTFASASFDGSIKLWHLYDFTCLSTYKMSDSNIYSLIQLKTGELIAGLSTDEIILLTIDNSTFAIKPLSIIEEHCDGVTALLQYQSREKNNIIIISGSYDHCLKIWDI